MRARGGRRKSEEGRRKRGRRKRGRERAIGNGVRREIWEGGRGGLIRTIGLGP